VIFILLKHPRDTAHGCFVVFKAVALLLNKEG
jgi:hypothetical protein